MVTHLPPSLIARVSFSCPAFIEVFQVCMSLADSLSAKIFMAEECQVSLRRDKLLLAGDAVIACRGRVIRKEMSATPAFASWKSHIYESM